MNDVQFLKNFLTKSPGKQDTLATRAERNQMEGLKNPALLPIMSRPPRMRMQRGQLNSRNHLNSGFLIYHFIVWPKSLVADSLYFKFRKSFPLF
jgi:hypothetical protein